MLLLCIPSDYIFCSPHFFPLPTHVSEVGRSGRSHRPQVAANFLVEHQESLIRDDYHKILRAFRAIDKDGKGYVELDVMKQMLQTRGEAFSSEELTLCQAGLESVGGKVYYEDYAHRLATSGKQL